MSAALASVDTVIARAYKAWKPPPRLSLSQWADEHFVLSPESSAEPGRWTCIPYQRGILDAFSDPEIERVSVMKSARIGWTKMCSILVAYHVAYDPCAMMVVQPTVEDAEGHSKEEIDPMIRDVPAVAEKFPNPEGANSGQTILHKRFRGGLLSLVGANSGRGFRRVSRKVVLFDETDGYPPAAGDEGDQIKLGIRRTETFWDRKIGAGSTPLVAGTSRIEKMFKQGDQRRYFVPCPHCGHKAPLVFRGNGGHEMHWPEGKPEEAFFSCQKNGCIIEHHDKRWMVERGEWRAAKPHTGTGRVHASFHIWAAYSYAANATWAQIAAEFLEATAEGPESLKTFVNTVLGETWVERGEAPDWQRLYDRREDYEANVVPKGALILTCGVDVMRDRLVYEVVAWGVDRQSWSIDIGILPGDPAGEEVWGGLDDLLNHEWPVEDGGTMRLSMLAIDSGDNTNAVYNWARGHPMSRVIATKGVSTAKTLIGAPTPVDVTVRGKRIARGYKVWPVGVDIAKSEWYGWLRLPTPKEEGEEFKPGFCHFPKAHGPDFFKQITAEHLVKRVDKRGFVHLEWAVIPNRENHWLDCRVLARAAAMLVGLDRHAAKHRHAAKKPAAASASDGGASPVPAPTSTPAAASSTPPVQLVPKPPRRQGTWLGGGRGAIRGSSWLRR